MIASSIMHKLRPILNFIKHGCKTIVCYTEDKRERDYLAL